MKNTKSYNVIFVYFSASPLTSLHLFTQYFHHVAVVHLFWSAPFNTTLRFEKCFTQKHFTPNFFTPKYFYAGKFQRQNLFTMRNERTNERNETKRNNAKRNETNERTKRVYQNLRVVLRSLRNHVCGYKCATCLRTLVRTYNVIRTGRSLSSKARSFEVAASMLQ